MGALRLLRYRCPTPQPDDRRRKILSQLFRRSGDEQRRRSRLVRGFTYGACYELALRITFVNFAAYTPGAIKEFSKRDQARVRAELLQIVDSFHVLR